MESGLPVARAGEGVAVREQEEFLGMIRQFCALREVVITQIYTHVQILRTLHKSYFLTISLKK